MTRWREPQPESSPYITPAGYVALEQEMSAIWKRRDGVTRALAAAAAEGDRSENAEYIYRKKELREIDRRIRYLQKRLPDLKIVREVSDTARIYFGAVVALLKNDEEDVVYRIVGADELDPSQGHISVDSPLARVLLKRGVDDEVEVTVRDGVDRYLVCAITYP